MEGDSVAGFLGCFYFPDITFLLVFYYLSSWLLLELPSTCPRLLLLTPSSYWFSVASAFTFDADRGRNLTLSRCLLYLCNVCTSTCIHLHTSLCGPGWVV